ncbi:hypothetical protein HK405_005044 [Cladochytrium tenue]|nr:hypothetical protein HK405_005044 [Cladochytrium tenue]
MKRALRSAAPERPGAATPPPRKRRAASALAASSTADDESDSRAVATAPAARPAASHREGLRFRRQSPEAPSQPQSRVAAQSGQPSRGGSAASKAGSRRRDDQKQPQQQQQQPARQKAAGKTRAAVEDAETTGAGIGNSDKLFLLTPTSIEPAGDSDLWDIGLLVKAALESELLHVEMPSFPGQAALRQLSKNNFFTWLVVDCERSESKTDIRLARGCQIAYLVMLLQFLGGKAGVRTAHANQRGQMERVQAFASLTRVFAAAQWKRNPEYYTLAIELQTQAFLAGWRLNANVDVTEAFSPNVFLSDVPVSDITFLPKETQRHARMLKSRADKIAKAIKSKDRADVSDLYPWPVFETAFLQYLSDLAEDSVKFLEVLAEEQEAEEEEDSLEPTSSKAAVSREQPSPPKSTEEASVDNEMDQPMEDDNIENDDEDENELSDEEALLERNVFEEVGGAFAVLNKRLSGAHGMSHAAGPTSGRSGPEPNPFLDEDILVEADARQKGKQPSRASPGSDDDPDWEKVRRERYESASKYDKFLEIAQSQPAKSPRGGGVVQITLNDPKVPHSVQAVRRVSLAIKEQKKSRERESSPARSMAEPDGVPLSLARGRRKWTEDEVDALEDGMAQFGRQWSRIEATHGVLGSGRLTGRDQIALKDKVDRARCFPLYSSSLLKSSTDGISLRACQARSEKQRRRRLGLPLGIFAVASEPTTYIPVALRN